ncbi:MAG: Gfo/Idh/MocA family oxidoreductase [Clostridia bacterium]|nr:Gfo/Idh/MocA family oxidoreductase [Clostridia bacterium]
MKTLVLIGAGARGMTYARLIKKSGRAKIVAVAELRADRRESAMKELGLTEDAMYNHADDLLAAGKLADVAIIATQDRDHYDEAIKALNLSYDLLLEKPISPSAEECLHISRLAQEKGCRVVVCHVLRYAPFFVELKKIIDGGELGRVIDIQHNENIGNFHMAHSYVRGNWRKSAEASPILLAKSCHDLDILVWLTGSRCESVASFGELTYFKEENAPAGSAARCLDCPVADTCRFDARKCYLDTLGDWPTTVLTLDQTKEGVTEAIKEGPYGRCVYRCDNDVCDHQVSILRFENGVTVTFNLSAFTNRIARTMKIMCEHGEIRASETAGCIEVIPFISTRNGAVNGRTVYPDRSGKGHGGGDEGIIRALLDMLEHEDKEMSSTIAASVESHLIAEAAERSRTEHRMVDLKEIRGEWDEK